MTAIPFRATTTGILAWAAPRLLVYVVSAIVVAFLFIVGAGIYALFSDPPAPIMAPSKIEVPKPTNESPSGPVILSPGKDVHDLIASMGSGPKPLTASNLLGVDIYGPDNRRVGKVTELVLDRNGVAQGVVLSVNTGYWWTKKEVLLPFNYVTWKSEGGGELGVIPYTVNSLQKLPVSPYPLQMKHE